MLNKHIVLAGDSIFDNDIYVPGAPGVLDQLRASLPLDWSGTKVAIDGDCTRDVHHQFANLPPDATDLIISVGGNDALEFSYLLPLIKTEDDLLQVTSKPLEIFRSQYREMLARAKQTGLRLFACTIYTAVPFENPHWQKWVPAALELFNRVIKDEAKFLGTPVLHIDAVCTDLKDFSVISPIEPSSKGGQKIVDLIISSLNQS